MGESLLREVSAVHGCQWHNDSITLHFSTWTVVYSMSNQWLDKMWCLLSTNFFALWDIVFSSVKFIIVYHIQFRETQSKSGIAVSHEHICKQADATSEWLLTSSYVEGDLCSSLCYTCTAKLSQCLSVIYTERKKLRADSYSTQAEDVNWDTHAAP